MREISDKREGERKVREVKKKKKEGGGVGAHESLWENEHHSPTTCC